MHVLTSLVAKRNPELLQSQGQVIQLVVAAPKVSRVVI